MKFRTWLRILRIVVYASCLLVCLGLTAESWISYDYVQWYRPGDRRGHDSVTANVALYRGRVSFQYNRYRREAGGERERRNAPSVLTYGRRGRLAYERPALSTFLGVHYSFTSSQVQPQVVLQLRTAPDGTMTQRMEQEDAGTYERTVFVLPMWIPLVLLTIPAVRFQVSKLRRSRRGRQGLCVHCGYDLRASAHRCPECGTAAVRGR